MLAVCQKTLCLCLDFSHDFEDAKAYGWNLQTADFDWQRLITNKNKEIERLNGIYKSLLNNANATLINAYVRITGPNEVEADGKRYTAERILIAKGGEPFIPEFPGSGLAINSDQAFFLEQFPKSVLMVSWGFMVLYFCLIFKGLG